MAIGLNISRFQLNTRRIANTQNEDMFAMVFKLYWQILSFGKYDHMRNAKFLLLNKYHYLDIFIVIIMEYIIHSKFCKKFLKFIIKIYLQKIYENTNK